MSAWTGSAFEYANELERERLAREAKDSKARGVLPGGSGREGAPGAGEGLGASLSTPHEPPSSAPLRRIFEEAPHLLSDEMRSELQAANERALKAFERAPFLLDVKVSK